MLSAWEWQTVLSLPRNVIVDIVVKAPQDTALQGRLIGEVQQ